MSTTIEQVRLDVVMQCLHLMGDVDAAIEAARRIVNFVAEADADADEVPAPAGRPAGIAVAPPRRSPMPRPARSAAAPPSMQTTPPAQMSPVAASAPPPAPAEVEAPTSAVAREPAPDQAEPQSPAARSAKGGTGVGRGAGPKARWDAEAEAVLRAEWGTGKPVEEIAAQIGRTVGSTRERARRLGLSRPKRCEVAPEYRPQPASRKAAGAPAASRGADVRSFKAKRSGRRRPRHEDMRRAEPIDISAYRIQRPGETIDSVVNFVRSRDYQVVRGTDGTFVVDGRKHFSEAAFVEWANGLRRMLNKPAFALECAHAT